MVTVEGYLLLMALTITNIVCHTRSSSSFPASSSTPPDLESIDPGNPSPDQDYPGQTKDYDVRKGLEKQILNQIRLDILRKLGLPSNRTSISVRSSLVGNNENARRASTMDLLKLIHEKKKEMEEKDTEQGEREKGVAARNRTSQKTVLFPEKVINATEGDLVEFKLNQNASRGFLVTGATMTVLVWAKTHTGNGSPKPETDRLSIKIYAVDETDAKGQEKAKGHEEPITELSVFSRRTQLQRLLLPTSFVQDVIDSQKSVLRLRVVCERCWHGGRDEGEAERVLTKLKKRRKVGRSVEKRKQKQLRERENILHTPFLTINSKRKLSAVRKGEHRMKASRSTSSSSSSSSV